MKTPRRTTPSQGSELFAARVKERGLNQVQVGELLAKRCNLPKPMTAGTVSRFASGMRKPSARIAAEIFFEFGVEPQLWYLKPKRATQAKAQSAVAA